MKIWLFWEVLFGGKILISLLMLSMLIILILIIIIAKLRTVLLSFSPQVSSYPLSSQFCCSSQLLLLLLPNMVQHLTFFWNYIFQHVPASPLFSSNYIFQHVHRYTKKNFSPHRFSSEYHFQRSQISPHPIFLLFLLLLDIGILFENGNRSCAKLSIASTVVLEVNTAESIFTSSWGHRHRHLFCWDNYSMWWYNTDAM